MIPIQILRCHIETDGVFHFGRSAGSAVRGALYTALTTMYDTQEDVGRNSLEDNPVAWLLRLEVDDDTVTGGKDVPRPMGIRPALSDKVSKIAFSLAFYGKAEKTISLVLSALPLMGELGIGRGRAQFRLVKVETVDPLTGNASLLIDEYGQTIGKLLTPPATKHYNTFARLLRDDRLRVNFLTPTRIIDRGNLCHVPDFRPWFQRLIERTRQISELYMEEAIWVPFGDLLTVAEDISMVEDETHWYEAKSGSRRDGMMKPISGFVGSVTYEGNFAPLLPYVLLGQALQVGKNTIKGCGWYKITYEWV